MTYLASDNTSAVCEQVMTALDQANTDHAKAYGGDEWTDRLTLKMRELFDHQTLDVFPVMNGSGANSMALAALVRPYESVLCHQFSHINQDECGMPEFFTGGKLVGFAGENGKISPDMLAEEVKVAADCDVHHARPGAISITQATEIGTVYDLSEIKGITDFVKAHDLHVHMDGARFANAVAALGCSPAQMTWQAGVDVLSFGGTKNGAMLAEAVVFFDPSLAKDFGYIRKRSGQLASKQRYISAQLLALLEGDVWLNNASHANKMAAMLEDKLRQVGIEIVQSAQTNCLFISLSGDQAGYLFDWGHYFYDWPPLGADIYRLVTSFATTLNDVENFIDSVRKI